MKYLSLLIFALFIISCGSQNSENDESSSSEEMTSAEEEVIAEEEAAVCIWDKVSVRETPVSDGKWKTSISIGETLTYLGEEATDSLDKNRKYVKVRLADGTEGWSVSDFIIVGGRVAVFLTDKDIYKRPDLLTKSDKEFSQMDIVAIKSEQEDWVEITGKRSEGKWIENGWVKKGDLSEKSIDVAVAKFASMAMNTEDEAEKIEKLEEIMNNSDFLSSTFIPLIEQRLEELNSSEVINIEEVEVDTLESEQ